MKICLSMLLAAVLLSGCAGNWPGNMPTETYSGTVYNVVTHRNEAGATVTAMRDGHTPGLLPGQGLVPIDSFPEGLAETRTGKSGQFILTTSSGYAQWLIAQSEDGKFVGRLKQDLRHGGENLEIKIEPR